MVLSVIEFSQNTITTDVALLSITHFETVF